MAAFNADALHEDLHSFMCLGVLENVAQQFSGFDACWLEGPSKNNRSWVDQATR